MLYAQKYKNQSENHQWNKPRECPKWGKKAVARPIEVRQHKVLNSTLETSKQSGKDHIYELENDYLFMYHILYLLTFL